jgi:pimeloyl-ACP methyl ester carboxylesterase
MVQKKRRMKKWYVLGGLFGLLILIGMWQAITSFYRQEEKELRRQIRQTVKDRFPEQSDDFLNTFGLRYFGPDRTAPEGAEQSRKAVVLVHGLDDPGKVWQNLAPELTKADLDVWLMHYPNDQPIVESARLLFDSLKELNQTGIRRISLVAHSMGGLVCREMLTRPDIDYRRSAQNKLVPSVAALIMVGTPNHGSQLARFRLFAEVRDQLVRLTRGEANWLGAVLDGAGEAKIDLLPGSQFLTELNARPHPSEVDLMIIAGIASPWDESDVHAWTDNWNQNLPEETRDQVDALGGFMISMAHGLGDGLVSVESTRLDGVPHRIVDGNHLTMIRNVTQSSGRVPPAVPIIVEKIKEEG